MDTRVESALSGSDEPSSWSRAAAASLVVAGGRTPPVALSERREAEELPTLLSQLNPSGELVVVVRDADLLPRTFVASLLDLETEVRPWWILSGAPHSSWDWLDGTASGRPIPVNLEARGASAPGLDDPELAPGTPLGEVLGAVALCGGTAPVKLVLSALGAAEDAFDSWIDRIDQKLVGRPGEGLLEDHEYGHPSFPGSPTYRLTPLHSPHSILVRHPASALGELTATLLASAESTPLDDTRGARLLELSLAMHAGQRSRAERCRDELALWVGPTEADGLTEWLGDRLDRRVERAERVLGIVEAAGARWPAYRSLAVLRPLVDRSHLLHPARCGDCHLLTAETLREIGELEMARSHCRSALSAYRGCRANEGTGIFRARFLAAEISFQAGELSEARDHLLQVAEHASSTQTAPSAFPAMALESLGHLERELGDPIFSRRAFEGALEEYGRLPGDMRPRLAAVHLGLCELAKERGDAAAARRHIERALTLSTATGEAASEDVVAILRKRSELERAAGDLEACLDTLQELVEIRLSDDDGSDPETLAACRAAADLAVELSRLDCARGHLERSLAIAEASGVDDAELVVVLKNLVDVLRRLGDHQAAREPMERARAIDLRLHGPDHTTGVIDLYVLAEILERTGESGAARRMLFEALGLAERILPPDDEGFPAIRTALDRVDRTDARGSGAEGIESS